MKGVFSCENVYQLSKPSKNNTAIKPYVRTTFFVVWVWFTYFTIFCCCLSMSMIYFTNTVLLKMNYENSGWLSLKFLFLCTSVQNICEVKHLFGYKLGFIPLQTETWPPYLQSVQSCPLWKLVKKVRQLSLRHRATSPINTTNYLINLNHNHTVF